MDPFDHYTQGGGYSINELPNKRDFVPDSDNPLWASVLQGLAHRLLLRQPSPNLNHVAKHTNFLFFFYLFFFGSPFFLWSLTHLFPIWAEYQQKCNEDGIPVRLLNFLGYGYSSTVYLGTLQLPQQPGGGGGGSNQQQEWVAVKFVTPPVVLPGMSASQASRLREYAERAFQREIKALKTLENASDYTLKLLRVGRTHKIIVTPFQAHQSLDALRQEVKLPTDFKIITLLFIAQGICDMHTQNCSSLTSSPRQPNPSPTFCCCCSIVKSNTLADSPFLF
jgi:hypothetical protein